MEKEQKRPFLFKNTCKIHRLGFVKAKVVADWSSGCCKSSVLGLCYSYWFRFPSLRKIPDSHEYHLLEHPLSTPDADVFSVTQEGSAHTSDPWERLATADTLHVPSKCSQWNHLWATNITELSEVLTLSLGLEPFLLSTISTMQLSPSKSPPLALYSSVFLLLPVPCDFVFPHRQGTEAEYQHTMAGFLLVNLSNHFNKKHSWVRREEQGRETQPEAE